MRRGQRARGVAGVLATFCMGSAAFAGCTLERIASLPVDVANNRPEVTGAYAGRPVEILIDTGAMLSFVTQSGAARLGLAVESAPGARIYGVGGAERVGTTWVSSLAFGQLRIRRVEMAVVRPPLAPGEAAPDFVIGEDVFTRYATELDFPDGKLRLWEPHGCRPEQLAYWTPNYSMAKLVDASSDAPAIRATLLLDGKPVTATFDTGAPTSWITRRILDVMNIPTEAVDRHAGAIPGGNGRPIRSEMVTLGTLALGDNETVRNVKLRVGHLFARDQRSVIGSRIPQRIQNLPQMLIGSDFFRSHRVMVWYRAARMFFSYHGGPVFQAVAPPR